MGSFSQKVKAFADRAIKVTEEEAKAASFELVSSVIKNSPTDKGTFVGNWIASKNQPTFETTEKTKTKDEALADVLPVLEDLKLDESFFLTNSLPYAHRLEYEYWSGQAPDGMVRINVQRIANNLRTGRK